MNVTRKKGENKKIIKMKIKNNNQMDSTESRKLAKGITLIALVITIIILLILAGVSIATLTGENGILTRASDAKETTEQAKEDELRQLTAIEAATYLEEHEYEDPSGETIVIPAQCAVSQVEGENTLEYGLVIIDKNGNEWVWIEVPSIVMPEGLTFETDEDYTTLITSLKTYTQDYKDDSCSDIWHDGNGKYYGEDGVDLNDASGCGLIYEEYNELYKKMLKSIYENNGFFVGKYEIGSFDTPVTANDIMRKAVIQKGAYPYNWVTKSQAQIISQELAIGDKLSSLIFGIQWDLVLEYVEDNSELTQADLKVDSLSWGNYRDATFLIEPGVKYAIDDTGKMLGNWNIVLEKYEKTLFNLDGRGTIVSTGATGRNSVLNIYDLAGNVWEWTLEKKISGSCVFRGGDFRHLGSKFTAWSRTTANSAYNYYDLGFRAALY